MEISIRKPLSRASTPWPGNLWLALWLFAAGLVSMPAHAVEPWTARLKGGGTVVVDPDTNRATVIRNGVRTPLWDGVHRLEDGGSLTVHSGIARPNLDIVQSREPRPKPAGPLEWKGRPIVGGVSPCQKLVARVCGKDDACAGNEACDLARQLLDLETDERQAAADPELTTATSDQCLRVELERTLFPTCAAAASTGTAK